MKIYLKLLTFLLFNFVLGVPWKYNTTEVQCGSVNNCTEGKNISQESKHGEDTVTGCDCGSDGGSCSAEHLKKCHTTESTFHRKHDTKVVQPERCTEQIHNSINCNFTQKEISDKQLRSTTVTSTVVDLNSSEDCSISNLKLGQITSDETSNIEIHCCGIEASSGNKIWGGTEAAIDEYPWLAMIEYERPFLCGGTLISSFYVLTAAHCLVSESLKPRGVKSVRLGEYDTRTDGNDCVESAGGGLDCTDGAVSITISNIIVHPEYNNANTLIVQANDIGLLKLSKSSPYTDFIRPICLPSVDINRMDPNLDLKLHVAGWGAVNDYQHRSDVKLQVELPIVEHEDCKNLYSLYGKPLIWDKQICAGGEIDKDTCKGDSGGPLIYSDEDTKINQIVGITSFGILKCGSQGRPSVYTKVIEYVPWILNTTRV